tara:strand:+ start:227 stop:928 length:702 start_codon:yes stop_codon:yes gene_type:complete
MTNHNLGSKKIIKDVIIVGVVVLIIWVGLQVIFGTANPFYVVSSGSMLPTLEVYDVIVVRGNTPFEDIKRGDIIVFFSPAKYEKYLNGEPGGEERVIVHRVDLIMEDDPKIVRTRGDNNPSSIQGIDFPITEKEYIGIVEYTVPQVGYITKILQPPVNYVIIAIIIGVMIMRHFTKKKDEVVFQHTAKKDEIESDNKDIPDISADREYVEKTEEPKESKSDNLDHTKPEDDMR